MKVRKIEESMRVKTFSSVSAKAGIPALAALLFTACSWECQGIPEELPWFIAEDYEGKTVFFTNGQDTVEVSYDYSEMDVEENRNHSMSRGRCHTSIVQAGCWGDSWALDALRDSLKDMNYVSPLSYGMWQECYNPNRSLDFGEIARLCHAASMLLA